MRERLLTSAFASLGRDLILKFSVLPSCPLCLSGKCFPNVCLPQRHSAVRPQPKEDRIGFAACCEDVAPPFRKLLIPILGYASNLKGEAHPHTRRQSRY